MSDLNDVATDNCDCVHFSCEMKGAHMHKYHNNTKWVSKIECIAFIVNSLGPEKFAAF